jgi:restriction system protein
MPFRTPNFLVTENGDYIVTKNGDRIIAGYEELDLELMLGVIVEPYGRTQDGELITLVAPAYWMLEELLQDDPEALFKLGDRKFEELIAGKYEKLGFRVTLTPRKGDHGVDVIAESHNGPRVRIFDQAKRYARGHVVPAHDVRALMGTWAFSNATHGVVTTTSDFAPLIGEDPYITNARAQGLTLINGVTLLQQLADLRPTKL